MLKTRGGTGKVAEANVTMGAAKLKSGTSHRCRAIRTRMIAMISCYEVRKYVGGIENSLVVGKSIVVLLGPRGFYIFLTK